MTSSNTQSDTQLNKLKAMNFAQSKTPHNKRKSSILKRNNDTESINSGQIDSPKRKSVYFVDAIDNFHFNKKESPARSSRKKKLSIDYQTQNKFEINFPIKEKTPETSHNLPVTDKFVLQITQTTKNNISINEGQSHEELLTNIANRHEKYMKGFSRKSTLKKMSDTMSKVISDKISINIDNTVGEDESQPGCVDNSRKFVNSSLFKNNEMMKSSMYSLAAIQSLTQPKTKEELKVEKMKQIIDSVEYPLTVSERVGCLAGFSAISFKNRK